MGWEARTDPAGFMSPPPLPPPHPLNATSHKEKGSGGTTADGNVDGCVEKVKREREGEREGEGEGEREGQGEREGEREKKSRRVGRDDMRYGGMRRDTWR